MSKGGEEVAPAFYGGQLGLREIPKPELIRVRGGVWFDADGLDIRLSVQEQRFGADGQRHFGLECDEVVGGLRARLAASGVATEDGLPTPWKRFFVRDPFGNCMEIHERGWLRA
jgi:hypothetical protein